ncbi:transporter [Ralstonia solanacearum]|uniref:SphA family protein n=1 Tax=Ralstonia solanacearum TaxID=305 RepID=UPI003570A498
MRLIRPRLAAQLSCLATAMLSFHAAALEGNAPTTPFGVFDFGAGMMPPPTALPAVGLRITSYTAKRMQDNRGNSTPLDVDLSVQSYGLAVVKTTSLSLLGGQYGWSFVAPVLSMKLDLGIPTPVGRLNQSGRNTALGDIQVSPITVSWTPAQNLFVNASLMLQLPTGSYDKNRLVNAGMNHWVVSPTVAFTYITSFGGEISSNIQLNVNGRNRDTDYRSGIEYQHEFAIGQHIGPWTVGIGGYYSQQITDDTQAGKTIEGNRARVFALGPAVYFLKPGSAWPDLPPVLVRNAGGVRG